MENIVSEITKQTVLVAPLNWGLGHASRCVPIIKELLKNQNTCIIASSGDALNLLRQEFPSLPFEEIPDYDIKYSNNAWKTFLKLCLQIPRVNRVRKNEQRVANQLVTKYNAHVIISDNRFGFRSPLCRSIFITHQIRIRMPQLLRWLEPLCYVVNRLIITKFDECWIPDYADERALSGVLSHSWKIPNSHFIGILSAKSQEYCPKTNDVVVILSGPEPQRTLFEKAVLQVLMNVEFQSVVVQGIVGKECTKQRIGSCVIQSYATQREVNQLLNSSRLVISRSGYSSLMDYENLQIPAILIPTEGQSEQSYLADNAKNRKNYYTIQQKNIGVELMEIINKVLKN